MRLSAEIYFSTYIVCSICYVVAKGQSKSSQPYLCYPHSNYIDYGSKVGMIQADHIGL